MLNFSPRSRDTLTREFWIREGIAHAKVAKDAKVAKAGKEYRGGRVRGTRFRTNMVLKLEA